MFYTKRLMLRNNDPRCDTNIWLQWMNNYKSAQTISPGAPRPVSLEDTKATVAKIAKGGDVLPCLAICLRPSDEELPDKLASNEDIFVKADGSARYPMIGALNLRGSPTPNVSVTHRTASLGILFTEEHQGKGYGPEVLIWVFGYLFDQMGLHRLEIQTLASNTPARKAYKKVGFVEEGRFRKAVFSDGKWDDLICLAILEEDWAKRKEELEA